MIRIFDLVERDATFITLSTEEIVDPDVCVYAVYDTSTGYSDLEDYYTWRTPTHTSTGVEDLSTMVLQNTTLFPKFGPTITNYNILNLGLLHLITYPQYLILRRLIDRIDLVRKRLPNPGAVVDDLDGVGNRGVVSMAGGYDKKFSVTELLDSIEGSLIEVNIHPPATNYYWYFSTVATEKNTNPYSSEVFSYLPYKLTDLIVQGALLRCLISWGLLEVDLHFTTTDSGLQVTYDKVGYVSSWTDKILNEFSKQKDFIKWDCVNSYGIGVGSYPYAASGIWGYAMSMIQQNGVVPLTSLLGFHMRSNTPL